MYENTGCLYSQSYNHVCPRSYNGYHTSDHMKTTGRSGSVDWISWPFKIGGGRFCQWQDRTAVRSINDKIWRFR